MKMNMKIKIRQPRLTVREQIYRDRMLFLNWKRFRESLTMDEMANIFRMPLAQCYKIIKKIKESKHETKIIL